MNVIELMRPRWRGQAGRLEVWYSTLTDPVTGTGAWLHHEFVAPSDGAEPHVHGWLAVFPPGTRPVLARFGPAPSRPAGDGADFSAPDVTASLHCLRGRTGDARWDLRVQPTGPPLYPFPPWAWRRELLPAAQVVPVPTGRFSGTVQCGQSTVEFRDAPGASARIYGHGNARAWGWLHADLGGGDVLEVVAAVSTRPGLRRLRPLTFLRLRSGGREWPALDQLLASPWLVARLDRPRWSVAGRLGNRRIHVAVNLPPAETVSISYRDPDGAAATCHNSERADAEIRLEHREGRGWRVERHWHLTGTAHAEIGERD